MTRAPALACLAALALAACAHPPPPPDPALLQRIATLEQKVVDLNAQIAAARTDRVDPDAVRAMLEQIDTINARVTRLESAPKVPTRPARPEPDRAATYSVPVDHDPSLGPAKAKVTLVMALDFACPYCRKAWDTMDQLRTKYGDDLRVVYKSFVVHSATATHSAQAACAATRQGKFRELADLLWTKSFDVRDFSDATVDALAAEAKLDLTRYQADISGPCVQTVKDEMAQLVKLGVGATPSFFINGRFMSGAMPIDTFAALVDEELAKANAAAKRGVKMDRYYEREIVGKGLKELAPTPPVAP